MCGTRPIRERADEDDGRGSRDLAQGERANRGGFGGHRGGGSGPSGPVFRPHVDQFPALGDTSASRVPSRPWEAEVSGSQPRLPSKRTPKELGGRCSKAMSRPPKPDRGGLRRGSPQSSWPFALTDRPEDPQSFGADGRAPPLTTVLGCENDLEGRFTVRASGDSHGGCQLSTRSAPSRTSLGTGGKGSIRPWMPGASRAFRRIKPTNGRRSACDRTGMRNRRGGPMRTLAFRRCAPAFQIYPPARQRLAARLRR